MTQESQGPDQNTPKEELVATVENTDAELAERTDAFMELAARQAEEAGLNELGARLRSDGAGKAKAKPEDKPEDAGRSGSGGARR